MYAGLLSWLLICLLASQFSVINPYTQTELLKIQLRQILACNLEIITHFDGAPVPTAGEMTKQLNAHLPETQ